MAASTMSMVQQSSQLSGRQSVSSRPHICSKPSAWLCRPAVRNVRPAAFRRQQCNPQQFRVNWGPNSRAYWNMGGPGTVKTLNELWKELERVNAEFEGGRWTKQQKPEPAADNGNDGMVLAVDIEQDDDGYTLMADVPGLAKEDLKVQVDKDRFLTISGERKRADDESNDKYEDRKQFERKFGKFSRKLKLPEDADVDCISARVDAGVLYLSIRRLEDTRPVDVPVY